MAASRQLELSKFFNVPNKASKRKSSAETKKEYEKKRVRGWVDSWGSMFDGLKDTEKGMVCGTCLKFRSKAGDTVFLEGCRSYRIDTINAHFNSPRHKLCREAELVAERCDAGEQAPGPMDAIIRSLGESQSSIVKKFFNTAFFVMAYEMPWTSYSRLLNLQVKNGSDIAKLESYQSDKACAR